MPHFQIRHFDALTVCSCYGPISEISNISIYKLFNLTEYIERNERFGSLAVELNACVIVSPQLNNTK